jgi:hypothetical protein
MTPALGSRHPDHELNGPADSCGQQQVPAPATLLLLGLGAGISGIGGLMQYRRG